MSHVTTGDICVKELADVEAALEEFPRATLIMDQTSFKWYGRWMNDWSTDEAAVTRGFDPKTFGQCDHVIHVDGVHYEIGLVMRPDGTGHDLMYDAWGHGGAELERAFGGRGLPRLKEAIGIQAATRAACELGYQVEEQQTEDGRRQLRVWGY